jgi:hypothetical protein
MTISFTTQPGFADLPNTALAPENVSLGVHVARIASNAGFGISRLEVFIGNYANGETVPLPVSLIDGYQYSLDELTFIWGIQTSVDVTSHWITGPDSLFYCAWLVDQATGTVSCQEWYRRSGDNDDTQSSNDGRLAVYTVAQRQQTTLLVASPLTAYTDVSNGSLVTDAALTSGLIDQLNTNAKFGALNTECIYMGEFYDSQTVPVAVSPADGYTYSYSQMTMVSSWRWTALGVGFKTPDLSRGQLGPIQASINQSTGVVSTSVSFIDDNGVLTAYSTFGRVAVFAFCTRHNLIDTIPSVANNFAEQDTETFFPGNSLRASSMVQLNENIREAAVSPEIFGPTLYKHGDLIPLAVSPIDGYTYARNEMFYVWDWADTTQDTGSNLRCPAFGLRTEDLPTINLDVWRLPPGGPYVIGDLTFPRVSVTVVAVRENNNPVNVPSDPIGNPTYPIVPTSVTGTQPVVIAAMLNCLVASVQIAVRYDFYKDASFYDLMIPSQARVDIPPTIDQTFSIQKFTAAAPTVGTEFATVTFSPGSYVGVFTGIATNFSPGDVLEIIGPVVPDATGAGMSFTLVGTQLTGPTLVALDVSPTSASIAVGATFQFVAQGTYDDGTISDLSGSVTWASSNVAVATVGYSTGGPPPATEDLLDWVMIAYPTRTTHHMQGSGTQSFYWFDADGQKYWLIKNQLGNPWDINIWDASNLYHWITENADENAWIVDTAFKRAQSPRVIGPRMFDLAGGPVTVVASGTNPLSRTLSCESDGEPLINLGTATHIWSNAGTISWGGSVGSQVTIRHSYYYGQQREEFNYCKGFGLVEWTHAVLTSGVPITGTYTYDQSPSLHVNLVAGGCPTPNFPCYSSIPGAGFTGSWIGGVPGAGGNVDNPTPGGGGGGGGITTGLATGVGAGSCVISATLGSIRATAALTVT